MLCTFNLGERVHIQASRSFLNLALAIGLGVILQSTAFSQEYRGTWDRRPFQTPSPGGSRNCIFATSIKFRIIVTSYALLDHWVNSMRSLRSADGAAWHTNIF
jgi:hypothetical protein